MEYSIYINQVKAVEWDLSMGEAILFSYLVNSCAWMVPLKTDNQYRWASNSKLQTELPLVCGHKASARRHMSALESKGLIDRITVANKSYFRVTAKGFLWRSDTATRANESVHPREEGERIGSPRANESVHQSDIPVSDIPNTTKKAAAYAVERESEKKCVEAYHEHIHWGTEVHKWTKARATALRKLLKNHPETRDPEIWDAYFYEASLDKFIRGEIRARQQDAEPFKANIDYLLREHVYVGFYEKSATREGVSQ